MVNQERQRDRHLTLFGVKLKRELVDDSDSEEGVGNRAMYGMRFEYITEVRLEISNQSFSAIQKVAQDPQQTQMAQPMHMKVLHTGASSKLIGSEKFYIYMCILDQVLVFERCLSDMTPSSVEMVRVLSSAGKTSSRVNTRDLDLA